METMEKDTQKVETMEKQTSKIEVTDTRVAETGSEQERLNTEQIGKLNERIKVNKIPENLTEYKNLLGLYAKDEAPEKFEVNVRYGKNISGEVRDGALSVDILSPQEFQAFDKLVETGKKIDEETDETKYFFDTLHTVGTTYSEVALGSIASTVMHESEHTIIDSRPGSKLETDFKDATGIENDRGGHTLSLLDEGITYAFQFVKDSESVLNQKLYEKKKELIDAGKLSPEKKDYLVESRERLGEALRPKVEEYLKNGWQINEKFLELAGEKMRDKEIVDVEKYVEEAEYERTDRVLSGVAEKMTEKENIPSSITDKEIVAPTGDKRDYVSVSPYSWQIENGSWITKDGEINPLTEKYVDENKLNKMSGEIIFISLAAEHTRDENNKEIFSRRVNETLKSWFVNKETRMNPNLENAQLSNPDSESGSFFGIIEGIPLVRIAESVGILKKNGLINSETQKGVEAWFDQYLTWLTTSEKGIGNPRAENEKEKGGERGMKNNHGTFYDVQVAYIADFLGKTDMAKQTLEGAKNRIASQIEPSGEMKEETARGEVSRDYQIFNLYAFAELASLGDKYDVDLWHYQTNDGRSLGKAFLYFDSQLKDAGDKPFKFDRTGPLYFAYREASKAYGNEEYENLPNKYYNNPLADEGCKELLRLRKI